MTVTSRWFGQRRQNSRCSPTMGSSRRSSGASGLPDDPVGAALLSCSDAGSFITGTNINVTGGGDLPWT